jgi:regulator of sigma E protease
VELASERRMIADILKFVFILFEVILIFNLMILVHELGHFLAARWRGLVVEKFAIWFGKPIWKKTINGVEYRLGSIPAGGFVAIPQLAPMEIMEGEVETDRSKLPPVKPLDKIIVAAAGPLFSFGLAVVLACLVWWIGRPIAETESTTVVGQVLEDGPAAKAGMRPGDRIVAVNGHPVTQFSPAGNGRASVIWNIVRSEAPLIPITFERDGVTRTVEVEPTVQPREGWGRSNLRAIGVAPAFTPRIASVGAGTPEAAAGFERGDYIVKAAGQPLLGLGQLLELLKNSGGKPLPVTIERDGQLLDKELPPLPRVVDSVTPDSPASRAGLQKGDVLVAADGQPIADLASLSAIVKKKAGAPIDLTVRRGDRTIDCSITPQVPVGFKPGEYVIGITWDFGGIQWDAEGRLSRIHPTPLRQIVSGATTMWDTLNAVAFSKSGIGLQHLSGPVGIMHVYYILFQREDGWLLALWFSVVLNINLALLNLLPIPVLDGGHITLAIIEGIRRRPINVRVLEVVQNACGLLIIGFILYVSFFDVLDLGGNRGSGIKFQPPPSQSSTP